MSQIATASRRFGVPARVLSLLRAIIDRTGRWDMTFVGGIVLLVVVAVLALWIKPDEELAA